MSEQSSQAGEGGSTTAKACDAAEGLLRSLDRHGVDYVFANLGTDHTPILEAEARLRETGEADTVPEIVVCHHEFVAMSAAHGYAAATGDPQAVLVHVDVGTQNLGAAVHNAHRAKVPVFLMSGLAPVTDTGNPGSRDHPVHYFQDVFDQPGILRQYCRWTTEFRPPADPDAVIARGLRRAQAPPAGPVYVSATREALETAVESDTSRSVDHRTEHPGTNGEVTAELAEKIETAEAPLLITTDIGSPPAGTNVDTLVSFAEAAGVGVVEQSPTVLNFPRTHELHVGFSPEPLFDDADLVLIAGCDVPWVPAKGTPDAPVIQIDHDVTKSQFPHWDFQIDRAIEADPVETLAAVEAKLEEAPRGPWPSIHETQRREWADTLDSHLEADRFTPTVLADILGEVIDRDTVLVADAVTSSGALQRHAPITEPGSYFHKGGAGLGWANGAAVGIKMADPDKRVLAAVGDGSYVFGNPTAAAWLSAAQNAPTLTVIFNNHGWNAVKSSTFHAHPDGAASRVGVPSSRFEPELDLSVPGNVVDAYTARAEDRTEFGDVLHTAMEALDAGQPAVIDAHIEPV